MTVVAAHASAIKPDHAEFPWEWFRRCSDLGRWPRLIANALVLVNGPRWSWRFPGNVIDLWKSLSRACPGFCGRDSFITAWRLLTHEGLVAYGKAGWRVVVRVCRRTKTSPENYVPDHGFQELDPLPVSGPRPKGTRAPAVVGCPVVPQEEFVEPTTCPALHLPPPPPARCSMPKPANEHPTPPAIPKFARPGRRNPFAYAYARPEAGLAPTGAQPSPRDAAASGADVGAMRGHPRRQGGLSPSDLERLRGLPSTEPTAAPEPPTPSPEQTQPVSTEATFWQSRYPKLCDLAERLWGSRGRANVELRTGVHPELLSWSQRATDSVWGEALAALARSKAEPGVIARYLVGVLRRTVPIAEKARRGDVTVPVGLPPEMAPPPPPTTKPWKRPTLADLVRKNSLAPEPASCNLRGARRESTEDQGAGEDRRHGGDRDVQHALVKDGRRAG